MGHSIKLITNVAARGCFEAHTVVVFASGVISKRRPWHCCRKQLNRTDICPRVPANGGRDALIAIWIDRRRNLRIRPWCLVGCIHPAQEKSLQIRQIELSVTVPAPCIPDRLPKSTVGLRPVHNFISV